MSQKTQQIHVPAGSPFPYKKGKKYKIERITLVADVVTPVTVTFATPLYTISSKEPITLHGPFFFEPAADGNFTTTGAGGHAIMTGVEIADLP